MNAFESLVASLLKRRGFWIIPSYKVALTKAEKRKIDRYSSPRWEIDLVAYKADPNEVWAVECKSFLDSPGVIFRNGSFEPPRRYKLFTEAKLRSVVLNRLRKQLCESGACTSSPTVRLCLAAGHIANKTNTEAMKRHFAKKEWLLFDATWICQELKAAATESYENDVAFVVAKLLLRNT